MEKDYIIKESMQSFKVRDEIVEVTSDFKFDIISGEIVSDENLDEIAINKAFDIYSDRKGLLKAGDLKSIRELYNLSQREFSEFTGIGKATIARYELGAIISKANNNVFKNLKTNYNFAKNLLSNPVINTELKDKIYSRIDELTNTAIETGVLDLIEDKYQLEGPSVYTGFANFNFDKFREAVVYLSEKGNQISKTKLNKLLFYADFLNFSKYTVSISGCHYVHHYYGPVPEDYEYLYSIMSAKEDIEWIPFSNYQGEYVETKNTLEIGNLNSSEKEILDKVIEVFRNDNSKSIVDKSHEESAYKETEQNEYISYEFAKTLKHIK